jgi:hypothetical protein
MDILVLRVCVAAIDFVEADTGTIACGLSPFPLDAVLALPPESLGVA